MVPSVSSFVGMLRPPSSDRAPVTHQRWKTVEAIYFGALDAPDRAAYLAEACKGDEALRADVELLLQDESTTIQLFNRFFSRDAGTVSVLRPTIANGSTLGAYEIVELIGSGG